jgi:pseudouridine 5'-phosphatase
MSLSAPNSMPTIQAVVFDLDGLMLNTEDIFDHAGRELMARRGLEMTDRIRDQMLGRRPEEAFQALKSLTGIADDVAVLMQETKQLFDTFAVDKLATMPGLIELLDVIERRATPKAVATSSPRAYMTPLLTRFDLLHRFVTTLTAEDVTHGKPNPEIYLTAASRLDVAPSQMLVLEDSETGTRAASSAGAFTVSVPNRHTAGQDFSSSHLTCASLQDSRLKSILS